MVNEWKLGNIKITQEVLGSQAQYHDDAAPPGKPDKADLLDEEKTQTRADQTRSEDSEKTSLD